MKEDQLELFSIKEQPNDYEMAIDEALQEITGDSKMTLESYKKDGAVLDSLFFSLVRAKYSRRIGNHQHSQVYFAEKIIEILEKSGVNYKYYGSRMKAKEVKKETASITRHKDIEPLSPKTGNGGKEWGMDKSLPNGDKEL